MHAQDVQRRFWAKVDTSGECWEWTACLVGGYGAFGVDGMSARSHRVSWEIAHGPIPHGLLVCHKCDNPKCVRPEHLFLGTTADNVADKWRKGRGPCGEKSGTAKLSEADVLSIHSRFKAGETRAEIAAGYGLDVTTIAKIITGRNWAHVARKVTA